MKIPKEFQLFGSTIKVVFNDERCDDKEAYGFTSYSSNTIFLSNKVDGKPISKDEMDITFIHEVLHFIFYKTKYPDLTDDERLITLMSRTIH